MTIRAVAAAAAVALTVLAPAAASAMEAEAAVKYRQEIMKAIGGHLTPVVMVLKGEVPYAEQMPANAALLAETAKLALLPFEQNTAGSGIKTTAKDEIWSEWEKFSGGMKKMEETTAQLAAAAESGDKAAIGEAIQAVGQTCKGCHDNFRTK